MVTRDPGSRPGGNMLWNTAGSSYAKVNLCQVVSDTDRLCGDGQRRVYGRRRREEGSVHYKQILMVERSAELVQGSVAWVTAEAHRAALMRDGETTHVFDDIELETDLFH